MYIYMYVCMYGTYVILYISMIYLSGALPQVWARYQLLRWPGYETWVRGQEHISWSTWRISELNCKTVDREERLRRRREYERAPRYAETAEQKQLC